MSELATVAGVKVILSSILPNCAGYAVMAPLAQAAIDKALAR